MARGVFSIYSSFNQVLSYCDCFCKKMLRTLLRDFLGEALTVCTLIVANGANDLSRVIHSANLGLHEEMFGMLLYIQHVYSRWDSA